MMITSLPMISAQVTPRTRAVLCSELVGKLQNKSARLLLYGPRQHGKTTLLKQIKTSWEPASCVLIDGREMRSLSPEQMLSKYGEMSSQRAKAALLLIDDMDLLRDDSSKALLRKAEADGISVVSCAQESNGASLLGSGKWDANYVNAFLMADVEVLLQNEVGPGALGFAPAIMTLTMGHPYLCSLAVRCLKDAAGFTPPDFGADLLSLVKQRLSDRTVHNAMTIELLRSLDHDAGDACLVLLCIAQAEGQILLPKHDAPEAQVHSLRVRVRQLYRKAKGGLTKTLSTPQRLEAGGTSSEVASPIVAGSPWRPVTADVILSGAFASGRYLLNHNPEGLKPLVLALHCLDAAHVVYYHPERGLTLAPLVKMWFDLSQDPVSELNLQDCVPTVGLRI